MCAPSPSSLARPKKHKAEKNVITYLGSTRQPGASGLSGSGFCSSFTRALWMFPMLPSKALLRDHGTEPCTETIVAKPGCNMSQHDVQIIVPHKILFRNDCTLLICFHKSKIDKLGDIHMKEKACHRWCNPAKATLLGFFPPVSLVLGVCKVDGHFIDIHHPELAKGCKGTSTNLNQHLRPLEPQHFAVALEKFILYLQLSFPSTLSSRSLLFFTTVVFWVLLCHWGNMIQQTVR